MPICALLVGIGNLEHGRFIEFRTEYLETDGELFSFLFQKSAWYADPADPRHICGQGENVGQIHAQRIACAFTEFERRGRRRRANNCINLLKGSRKVLTDQGTNLLGPQIISIIITRAQYVGAQNDATFDLGAETLFSRSAVVVKKTAHLLSAKAVSHSVESGEVRRSLGGGDNIIRSEERRVGKEC